MRFLAYALIGALSLGSMFAYIAGSPFVFIEIFGMAPDDDAMLFGVTASSPPHPRYGPARLLSIGTASCATPGLALVVVVLTGWGGVPAFMVPVTIAIGSLGLMLPNTSAMTLSNFPAVAGDASALPDTIQIYHDHRRRRPHGPHARRKPGARGADDCGRGSRQGCGGGWRRSSDLDTPLHPAYFPPMIETRTLALGLLLI